MVNTYKVVLCGKTGVGKTSIFRRVCGFESVQGCARNSLDLAECNVLVKVEQETTIKVFFNINYYYSNINPFTLQDARKC